MLKLEFNSLKRLKGAANNVQKIIFLNVKIKKKHCKMYCNILKTHTNMMMMMIYYITKRLFLLECTTFA